MNDTVVLVPVLNRPERAQPCYDSFVANTRGARLLFIGTEGDVAELRAVNATGADVVVFPGKRNRGDYSRKINFGYRTTTEPLIFLAADDIVFSPGWLTVAKSYLDGTIQVVGTNDLTNERVMAGKHSTHTLVTRDYVDTYGTIDTPGQVLCELYNHWYVDDEFVQTAQMRGMFASALDSHVEHLHYFVGKSPKDKTYRVGESRRQADRQKYAQRCPMWKGFRPEVRNPTHGLNPETGLFGPLPV